MADALCVYAIVGRSTTLPPHPLAGIGGELSMVPCRDLAAITGRVSNDEVSPSIETVLHHQAIVEIVRRAAPALPVRFGTVLRDRNAVARALDERYDALIADLSRLGDKVEVALTALWETEPGENHVPTPDPEHPVINGTGAGALYLRVRAEEFCREDFRSARAQALSRQLEQGLGGLSLDRRIVLLPAPTVAFRMAFLLDPLRVGAFRLACDVVRRAIGEVRVLLTGPWPPYTFVTRERHG